MINTLSKFRAIMTRLAIDPHTISDLPDILQVIDLRLSRLEDHAGIPLMEDLRPIRRIYKKDRKEGN